MYTQIPINYCIFVLLLVNLELLHSVQPLIFNYSVAMELALSLEKLTNEKLLNVHAVSSLVMLVGCIYLDLDIF